MSTGAGVAGATGDCATCPWYKSRGNKKKGHLIPGGFGKCTRPQGHCHPEKPRLGIGGVKHQ
ncbi:MAG: hypothetical protein M1438_03165 [Deltaproteobacteria bacterium]|nr:hypothetical protein [Deltaproteobacteria bacterium]